MKTCEYAGEPFAEPRSHPWRDAAGNPDCRYYDLTASPAHIRTSLEDLLPWSHYPAIEAFYQLLERLIRAGANPPRIERGFAARLAPGGDGRARVEVPGKNAAEAET